jgi:hypothetical protein
MTSSRQENRCCAPGRARQDAPSSPAFRICGFRDAALRCWRLRVFDSTFGVEQVGHVPAPRSTARPKSALRSASISAKTSAIPSCLRLVLSPSIRCWWRGRLPAKAVWTWDEELRYEG